VRVAALYDVHGNAPALEAVLAEVEREGFDHIVVGGDLVSGPLPRETLELATSIDAVFVRGNADRLASPAMNPEWDADRRWVEAQLDERQIAWLAGLELSAVLDGTLYVHATPQDDETVFTELTTDERMAELFGAVEESRVVVGHTHMQLVRQVGGVTVVNAGSVGMPYEPERGAYWAAIGDDVELRRTDYDYEQAAELIRATGYPHAAEIADENVLTVPTRQEALAAFGG
jgi:putative phosphoesterase